MILEKAQNFTSIDGVHKMIIWSKHYLGSEKRGERLKYRGG